uniref:Uncharacterized protein n=1 Tax=Ciona intestinalis TaxID=7719 RepID=H2XNV3_CIOIN
MFLLSMNTICTCASWAVTRTMLILLSKYPKLHVIHDYFIWINVVSFSANFWNMVCDVVKQPSWKKIPTSYITSLNCCGGTPGTGLCYFLFQQKQEKSTFLIICAVQCAILMPLIENLYPRYPSELQVTHTLDEIVYTHNMFWKQLFNRFNYNTSRILSRNIYLPQKFDGIKTNFMQ